MNVMRRCRGLLIERGPLLGLVGVAIAVTASLVTAIAYSGLDGEPYSPLHHTVSELGERGVSELAAVFNLGLMAGGVLIARYMLGRSCYATLQDRSAWVFGALGLDHRGHGGILLPAQHPAAEVRLRDGLRRRDATA